MSRSNSTALLAVASIVVIVASSFGCASIRAANARNTYIQRKTKQYVYDKPCRRVWPTARQLLFERGYAAKNTGDVGGMTVETEWRYDDETETRSRYLVQGTEPRKGKCKVRFNRMTEHEDGDMSTLRDTDAEWQLLQRVAPQDAAEIQKTADIKAERARNK